jgi:hypothetical protein
MSTKRRILGVGGALAMVACSGAIEADGWGEVNAGPHASMANAVLSSDTDVSADELAPLDAPSDDEMIVLADDALVNPDARPDVPYDGPMSAESTCGALGNHPSYAEGTQLVTTEWLNLRTAPGIDSPRILVMAPSTAVTVLSRNCGHRWVNISDGSHQGYAAIDWLRVKSKSSPQPEWEAFYSPSRGEELAKTAWEKWHGIRDSGWCLRGVEESITASIDPGGIATGSAGASQFGDFALDHTAFMRHHHLKAFASSDPAAPAPKDYPKGTIIVWHPNHCGSDKTYGHVEVIINDKTACSDYCRKRSDQWCAPDVVILPRH